MATDMGKSPETKNIIWLTNWRRNAKRKGSKESMTDSYEIMNSVSEWLNIIEMKKFVDDGMFLQMKVTLITCQKKKTSTTRTKWWLHLNKSGSDTLPLRKRSDFKLALYTLERLHQEAGEKPSVPTYSYKEKQLQSASSSSSTWWKWQDSWWSSWNSEVKEEASKVLGMDGETRYWQYFDENLQKMAFKNSIYFVIQIDRLQLTAVYCDRRGVKTTPQMTRFRDVQQAIIMATVWIDDDKIKSDYNRKLWITYAWWNRTIRRPTPMTTWQPRPTQCTWNTTLDKWMCA